jgi:hypothetical protein
LEEGLALNGFLRHLRWVGDVVLLLSDYLAQRWDQDEADLRRLVRRAPQGGEQGASQDPKRLLAEIAAKRGVLLLHRPVWPDEQDPRCASCGDGRFEEYRGPWPCLTLLTLAQPLAGHPGFEPAWVLPASRDGGARSHLDL